MLRCGPDLSTEDKSFKVTFQITANSSLVRSYLFPDRNSALAEIDGFIYSFRISGQLEILAVSLLPAQTDSLELTRGDQSSVEASDLLCALGRQVWHCPAIGNSHCTNHTAYPQRYDWQSA